MNDTITRTPRVYIASLSDYNSGVLHGRWIDLADTDADALQAEIADMLAESPTAARTGEPAEEWAAHDYEDMPSGLGEFPDIGALVLHGAQIAEHGDAWLAFVSDVGAHFATAEDFADRYSGHHDSAAAWAEDWLTESGMFVDEPDTLRRYFDFDAYARDAGFDGWSFEPAAGGGVHVFAPG